mgnify:FL=1
MNLPIEIQRRIMLENPFESGFFWGVQADGDGKIFFETLFTSRAAVIGFLGNALNFPGQGEFYVLKSFDGVISTVFYYNW